MAVWDTPTPIRNGAVWWFSAGATSGSLQVKGNGQISKIVDGQGSGDTKLTVGETVTISIVSGSTHPTFSRYVFQGVYTFDGKEYPVVSAPDSGVGSFWYVVGLPRDTEGLPATLSITDLDRSDFTVCFFPGTLITTPSGERKVEELVPGDLILIGESGTVPATWIARMGEKFSQRLGSARAAPVKWIGRQMISTLFGPAERLMPVRFAAGSLGVGGGGATPSAA